MSGWGWFWIFMTPFIVAGVGFLGYNWWMKDGFGRLRLPESIRMPNISLPNLVGYRRVALNEADTLMDDY